MNLNHRKTLSDLRVFSFFAKTHLIIFILHSQKNFSKKFKKFQKSIVGTAGFRPLQKYEGINNSGEPWKQNKQHSSLYPFGRSNKYSGARTCFYRERLTEIKNRSVVRSDCHEVWIGIMILPSSHVHDAWAARWVPRRGESPMSTDQVRAGVFPM